MTDAPVAADIPGRVNAHMQSSFPDDVDAAGWICARDYRDNTAVVVWRPAEGAPAMLPGGARATVIARWHMSLQNAGFISNPRTDMEVFGRPEEQSDDGRARWLHITGWDPELVVSEKSVFEWAEELIQKVYDRRERGRS